MCTHLAKRGAVYYFRRVIPLDLRSAFDGRAEIMLSLRTKDRDTAKRLIPDQTIRTDRLLEAARRRRPQDRPEKPAERVSGQAGDYEAAMLQAGWEAAQDAEMEEAAREARHADREPLRRRLEAAFRRSTAEITPEEAAMRDLLRDAHHALTLEQERWLSERVRRAESRRGITAPADAGPSPAKPSALPLMELFDAYAKEQGMKAVTANEWRGNLRALVGFIGHDDAARLTVEDIDRWRDHLLSETTKRSKPRSPRTVKDKYVSALRSTLNYAISKRKLRENVAAQVTVRVPRRVKLRERDFTETEARTILAATMEPAGESGDDHAALARRWVPWLCAYTGARVNEIGQLRGSDVAERDGIWSIRITPEAGTVKANEARTVPLHPHLIEQGFPAVARAAGDAPIFYDPGKVRRPGDGNRHVKKVGERLATWVRKDVGITDPNLQPNHGWRHMFKTLALEAGIPERVADAIQGHAPRSVGQTYGSVSLRAMSDAIGKLPRFPGP